jgi:hypothetical protein
MGWLSFETAKKRESMSCGGAGSETRKFVAVAIAEISPGREKIPKFDRQLKSGRL